MLLIVGLVGTRDGDVATGRAGAWTDRPPDTTDFTLDIKICQQKIKNINTWP
jgi:hypothetical protein